MRQDWRSGSICLTIQEWILSGKEWWSSVFCFFDVSESGDLLLLNSGGCVFDSETSKWKWSRIDTTALKMTQIIKKWINRKLNGWTVGFYYGWIIPDNISMDVHSMRELS